MKTGGQQTTTTSLPGPSSTYLTGILAKNGQPDYTAVNAALNGADNQQWQNFYNTQLPLINQKASFLGNQSAGIKDLNSAVSQIGQAQTNMGQAAYLGQYDQAQANALNAAGMLGRTTTQSMTPGSGATLANILGGGLAGSALISSLLGGGSNGQSGGSLNTLLGAGKTAYNWLTGAPSLDISGASAVNPADWASAYGDISGSTGAATDAFSNGLSFGSAGGQAAADAGAGANAVAGGAGAADAGFGGEMAGGLSDIPLGAGAAAGAEGGLGALGAGDLAASTGAGGDAAINAAIQAYADQGIAGTGAGGAAGAGGLGTAAMYAGPIAAMVGLGLLQSKQSDVTPAEEMGNMQSAIAGLQKTMADPANAQYQAQNQKTLAAYQSLLDMYKKAPMASLDSRGGLFKMFAGGGSGTPGLTSGLRLQNIYGNLQ